MTTSGPLILKGNLKLGASAGSAIEVGDAITGFKLSFSRDQVQIPATLGAGKYKKNGGVEYSVQLDYFSNDVSATADVFGLLWATAADDDGLLYFEGSLRNGVVSANNPKWAGTFSVNGAQLGGNAEDLSTGSGTFPLQAAPTKSLS